MSPLGEAGKEGDISHKKHRLIVITKKKLPEIHERSRYWGFVETADEEVPPLWLYMLHNVVTFIQLMLYFSSDQGHQERPRWDRLHHQDSGREKDWGHKTCRRRLLWNHQTQVFDFLAQGNQNLSWTVVWTGHIGTIPTWHMYWSFLSSWEMSRRRLISRRKGATSSLSRIQL